MKMYIQQDWQDYVTVAERSKYLSHENQFCLAEENHYYNMLAKSQNPNEEELKRARIAINNKRQHFLAVWISKKNLK